MNNPLRGRQINLLRLLPLHQQRHYRRRGGFVFFSSRRRQTSCLSDWSSDVCSSDLWSTPSRSARPPEPARFTRLGGSGGPVRSEERRGGEEGRSRWSRDP